MCVCLSICPRTYACKGLWKSEEAQDPGPGISGGCELPHDYITNLQSWKGLTCE